MTRTVAIVSGKGGVGKSNVSVNLALSLARRNKAALLLDADLGLANVDVLLGLNPRANLQDVLNGTASLEDIVVEGPSGISIIPASSGGARMGSLTVGEHAGLISAFEDYAEPVDVLLVDVASGVSDSVVSFCKAVHDIVVVVCDEPTSMADAYALIKVLNRDHGIDRFRVLANMVRDEKHGMELFQNLLRATDKFLNVGLSYLGALPFDDSLKRSVSQQKAVVEMYPRSKIAGAFNALAARVDCLGSARGVSGRLQFFVERLIEAKEARIA